jgi:TP901 family phage tail tape measure protein
MTTRTMEARAVISAVDRTGTVLSNVAGKMRAISSTARQVNAAIGQSGRAVSVAAAAQGRAASASSLAFAAAGRFLAPAAVAYGAARAISNFAEVERRMTRIGITADASREEIAAFAVEARNLASATAQPFNQIAAGADALAAQGRNLSEIRALLPSVARTAQAAGAQTEDIAKSADAVGTHLMVGAGEMQKAFDIMAEGGKAGQFELKDMARYLPSLAPAAKALGLEGTKGLSELVAMLQVIRKGSGSSEEAATAMNNILQKMSSEETTKRFKKMGVDLEAALKKGRAEGRNLLEVFEDATWKAVKGDLSQLPKVINDMEFARGMRAVLSMRGEWQKLADTISKANGTVDRDLKRVLGDAQGALDRAAEAGKRATVEFGRFLGNAGATRGLAMTAEAVDSIANALERVNQQLEQVDAKPAGHMLHGDQQEKLNVFMNGLVYGAPQSSGRGTIEAAHATKFDRDRIDTLRTQLEQAAAKAERQIAEFDRIDASGHPMARAGATERARLRRSAAADALGWRSGARDLDEALAARDRAMVEGTEIFAQRRRIARDPFHNPIASSGQIGRGAMPLGTRGWGAMASPFGAARVPLPLERPAELQKAVVDLKDFFAGGNVNAKLEGKADVSVTVRVEGEGRVTGMSTSSSGHVRASVGTSMPQVFNGQGR